MGDFLHNVTKLASLEHQFWYKGEKKKERKRKSNKREQAKIAFVSCSLSEQILFTFKLHKKYPI